MTAVVSGLVVAFSSHHASHHVLHHGAALQEVGHALDLLRLVRQGGGGLTVSWTRDGRLLLPTAGLWLGFDVTKLVLDSDLEYHYVTIASLSSLSLPELLESWK